MAFVALVGLSFGSTTFVSSKQADDGLNINLAGRQRMLSQKMSKEALMYSQSVSRGANAAELERNAERVRASMEVFATTLAALKDGGEAPLDVDQTEFASLSGATSSRIAAQLGVVQAKWEPFAANIERVLTSGGADTAAMDYVMENNGDILASMNAAVTMMQADADARVTQLLVLQLALLVLGLGLVAYGWLSIRRSVARPLQDLANVAEHLAEGKLDADIPKQDVAELAELAGSFDRMRNELNTTITNLEATARQNAGLAKEAEEATQAKSEFLASMSHELRTPMNAIIGFTALLSKRTSAMREDTTLSEKSQRSLKKQKQFISQIEEASTGLLQLINQILDISKIEAGQMDVFTEDIAVSDLVQGIAATADPLVQKKGNTLTIKLPDPDITMNTDITKVRQCLLNLVSNAAKFTDNGEITLAVRGEERGNGEVVVFDVIDTGIGMTELQVGRIFNRFSQADSSTTRRYGGTGLGLNIVRQISEMLGGTITVRSELHRGSTFTLTIPVRYSETREEPRPEAEDDTAAAK
ncbi:MAG: type IV pili methyl-accepting chemotaxis transducer N-terminal domain-containing protein [Alphaproteobacteria bacterium]|nr:type IV pili methyl-accepting chemotaxis transducer N-terminal domain-containing protein [Alphaproteobacteria bacterium]